MNMSKPFTINLQFHAEEAEDAGKVNFGDILRKHVSAEGVIDVDKAASAISSAVGRAFIPKARFNAKLEEIDTLTKDKEAAEEALVKAQKFEKKFNDEHEAFEKYKSEVDAKAALDAVKGAYKGLLTEANIDPELHDTIISATNFDGMKRGEDGKLEKADDLKKSIETKWAKFRMKAETKGADVKTPPAKGSPSGRTKQEIMEIKDAGERQRAIAENHELFGF